MADCGVGARLEVLRPVGNDDFDASMAILKRRPGSQQPVDSGSGVGERVGGGGIVVEVAVERNGA